MDICSGIGKFTPILPNPQDGPHGMAALFHFVEMPFFY